MTSGKYGIWAGILNCKSTLFWYKDLYQRCAEVTESVLLWANLMKHTRSKGQTLTWHCSGSTARLWIFLLLSLFLIFFLSVCMRAFYLIDERKHKRTANPREHSLIKLRIFYPQFLSGWTSLRERTEQTELIVFSWEDCAVFFNAKPHHCWFSTRAVRQAYWSLNNYLFELNIVMPL